MDIVKETPEQWHEEPSKKELLKVLLKEAIQDGDSQQSIHRLIRRGNFTKEEIEEIYREAENR